MAEQTRIRMTAEEFLQLPETTQITELIEGEVFVSPSGTDSHQVSVFATGVFLQRNAPNGQMRIAPMDVHFDNEAVVEPDVFWVSDENTSCRVIDNKYWQGAPDLIVEVLSPSTARRDYGKKYDLYERYGVREFWISDPVAKMTQVYGLQEGKFTRFGVFGISESFTSPVLGVEVDVRMLFGE